MRARTAGPQSRVAMMTDTVGSASCGHGTGGSVPAGRRAAARLFAASAAITSGYPNQTARRDLNEARAAAVSMPGAEAIGEPRERTSRESRERREAIPRDVEQLELVLHADGGWGRSWRRCAGATRRLQTRASGSDRPGVRSAGVALLRHPHAAWRPNDIALHAALVVARGA